MINNTDYNPALHEIAIDKNGHDYLFSVIMPIYNTEKYLEEAIDSVIQQTIDFKENIQLILVNNATQDNSGSICEEYKQLYPNNIEYVELEENVGPSGARNQGMKYAKGRYINFMDSDDKWDVDAFINVYQMFIEEGDKIDCIACRMLFFDRTTGKHPLDHRFSTSKVVNIYIQYSFLQVHVNSVFFTSESIKNEEFDISMNHAEDTKFFNLIMLRKGKYGVLREAVYYYRKRSQEESLLNEVQGNIDYYTIKVEKSLGFFIDYSIEKYGFVIPYVQNMIAYAMKWRIKDKFNGEATEEDISHAMDITHNCLKYVSDEIILEQKSIYKEHKLFALSMKYGQDMRQHITVRDNRFYLYHHVIFDTNSRASIKVIDLNIKKNSITIKGRINLPLDKNTYDVFLCANDDTYHKVDLLELDIAASKFFLGTKYHEEYGYTISLPLKGINNLQFVIRYKDYELPFNYGFMAPSKMSEKYKNTYCVIDNYIFNYNDGKLVLRKNSFIRRQIAEIKLCAELCKRKRWRSAIWRQIIRFNFVIKNINDKKKILLLDNFSKGGDNAEILYRYIVKQHDSNLEPFFCVAKDYSLYNELREMGKVVNYNSKKYRINFAVCDILASSQTFYGKQNTFRGRTEDLKDLFNWKFVYLQHGVIKDDHSETLNSQKRRIDMFVTSAKPEYNSILSGKYGYDEDIVKLTGLARHDVVYNAARERSSKEIIRIAPTWRYFPNQIWDEENQQYTYSDAFIKSEFYQFFNSIINNNDLLCMVREKKLHIEVQLHPRIAAQACDFHENDVVSVVKEEENLSTQISNTCLLLTDYSSVAFDYAYAGVPIVYAQFDRDDYYKLQPYYSQGYYDYERDGFGPVCISSKDAVDEVIKILSNEGVMENKYTNRVEKFFENIDNSNCERIYDEIIKLLN